MAHDIHIFTAPSQPATCFITDFGVMRFKPRALIWCRSCRRRHQARNMIVKVHYDGPYFFCADKARCKRRRL
jgi:hypothetical protein